MSFQKEIPKLLEEGVIDKATADRLSQYYLNKASTSANRLFLVFGALGASLIGLGIILILAHNWDDLSRFTKTIFAFIPLLIGQILCGYTLWKKPGSATWRESSAIFLFFAVGASIALVSQIYHLPGELSSFLFTWAILVLPIVYLMRSTFCSIFYLLGITWYVILTSFSGPYFDPIHFWWMFLAIIPFYVLLYRIKPGSNSTAFHNWLVPASGLFGLMGIFHNVEELAGVIYCSAFGLVYLIGHSYLFNNIRLLKNGFKVIGALGTIILLLIHSFNFPWKEITSEGKGLVDMFLSIEGHVALLLIILCYGMLYFNYKHRTHFELKPLSLVFAAFAIIFVVGLNAPTFALISINALLLIIGVLTIKEGGDQDHLGILNFGMLVIGALVVCRFFDADLSFVFRGILFVLVGIGFFIVNYWLLNKRKKHAE